MELDRDLLRSKTPVRVAGPHSCVPVPTPEDGSEGFSCSAALRVSFKANLPEAEPKNMHGDNMLPVTLTGHSDRMQYFAPDLLFTAEALLSNMLVHHAA